MTRTIALAAAALFASAAFAAPKLESIAAKPSGNTPDVEISVSIGRTKFDTGNCDARIDFGDGQGRNVEFGVARTRTVRHSYKKNGSYTVSVRGAGATPCEGTQQAPVQIAGAPEPKKAEPKKAEPAKKAEPKKVEAKKKAEPKKKPQPKKKAEPKKKPAPKGEAKKGEPKKAEPKKKAPPKKDEEKK